MNDCITKMKGIQFIDELKVKGKNHNNYKYYASNDRICQIFTDKALYLSDGSKWNDLLDDTKHAYGTQFAKCFSFTREENFAMWDLYADRCHGSMIDFSKKFLNRIIESNKNNELQIGKMKNNNFVLWKTRKPVDLYLIDVCYKGSVKPDYVNLYRSKQCYQVSEINECSFPIKKYAWSYESECRLIASFEEKFQEDDLFVKLLIPEETLQLLKSRSFLGPLNEFAGFNTSDLYNNIRGE